MVFSDMWGSHGVASFEAMIKMRRKAPDLTTPVNIKTAFVYQVRLSKNDQACGEYNRRELNQIQVISEL